MGETNHAEALQIALEAIRDNKYFNNGVTAQAIAGDMLPSLASLRAQLAEKDHDLESAAIEKVDFEGRIESLQIAIAERDREIERLKAENGGLWSANIDMTAALGHLSAEFGHPALEGDESLGMLLVKFALEQLSASQARERKALEDAQTLIESGSPQMALMVILAALNGDSPDGADNNRSQTPEPPKEDSRA